MFSDLDDTWTLCTDAESDSAAEFWKGNLLKSVPVNFDQTRGRVTAAPESSSMWILFFFFLFFFWKGARCTHLIKMFPHTLEKKGLETTEGTPSCAWFYWCVYPAASRGCRIKFKKNKSRRCFVDMVLEMRVRFWREAGSERGIRAFWCAESKQISESELCTFLNMRLHIDWNQQNRKQLAHLMTGIENIWIVFQI